MSEQTLRQSITLMIMQLNELADYCKFNVDTRASVNTKVSELYDVANGINKQLWDALRLLSDISVVKERQK